MHNASGIEYIAMAVKTARTHVAHDLPCTARNLLRTSLKVRSDTARLARDSRVFGSLMALANSNCSEAALRFRIEMLLFPDKENRYGLVA